jgi:propionyl-CoA carboxylase alpha chain
VSWWGRVVDPDELDLAGLGQPSSLPDDQPPVAVMSACPEQVVLDVAGVRLAFTIHRVGSVTYVDSVEGSVVLDEVPRYPIPVPVPVDDSPN